jgi:hypothetical protein
MHMLRTLSLSLSLSSVSLPFGGEINFPGMTALCTFSAFRACNQHDVWRVQPDEVLMSPVVPAGNIVFHRYKVAGAASNIYFGSHKRQSLELQRFFICAANRQCRREATATRAYFRSYKGSPLVLQARRGAASKRGCQVLQGSAAGDRLLQMPSPLKFLM